MEEDADPDSHLQMRSGRGGTGGCSLHHRSSTHRQLHRRTDSTSHRRSHHHRSFTTNQSTNTSPRTSQEAATREDQDQGTTKGQDRKGDNIRINHNSSRWGNNSSSNPHRCNNSNYLLLMMGLVRNRCPIVEPEAKINRGKRIRPTQRKALRRQPSATIVVTQTITAPYARSQDYVSSVEKETTWWRNALNGRNL